MAGVDRLAADLRAVGNSLEDPAEPTLEATRLLAERAQVEAPKRTGFLAASITPLETQVAVFAPYGPPVHARTPFLARAADAVDWVRPYEEWMDDRLGDLSSSY